MGKPNNTLLGIAVFGMLVGIVGSIFDGAPSQKWCFLATSVLMTPLALLKKDAILIAIQAVSLVGALVGLMDEPSVGWQSLPVVVAVAISIWLKAGNHIDQSWRWLGVLGTTTLGLGYATQMSSINIAGGLLLAGCMAAAVKSGQAVAWLWLSLNIVFVVTSVIGVFSN